MKKTFAVSILVSFLMFWGAAFVRAHSELPAPGILPTSRIYFIKTWGEQITLIFTFNKERKAARLQEFAERRLAEATAVAAENPAVAGVTAGRYAATIAEAAETLPVSEDNKKPLVSLKERSLVHQEVLAELEGSVPEEARGAIIKAEENSSKHVSDVVEKVEGREAASEFLAKAEQTRQVVRMERIERAEQAPMESGKEGGAPKELQPLREGQELRELNPLLPTKETGGGGEKGVEPVQLEGPAPMAPPIPQR